MDKIMEFAGTKKISIVNKDDTKMLLNMFPDNDVINITLYTKRDLNLAIKSGAKIYVQEITTDKTKIIRYFVRVNRERLFAIAEI